jgi:uncharacterized protein (DUF305 family)
VTVAQETTEPGSPAEDPLRSRLPLVLGVGAVVLLIVGALFGMLINSAMNKATGAPDAGSVDVGFAQDMRVHHLQAVTMAGIIRDRTEDSLIHSLAFDIESTQLTQAGEMTGWLTAWSQPELPPVDRPAMQWMTGASGHAHSTTGQTPGSTARMPGMATTDELNRFRGMAPGIESDIYFLQLMLRHHQGALPMAQYAADHGSTGYVRDLGRKIVEGQTKEVELMTGMLAKRGAVPLPSPN